MVDKRRSPRLKLDGPQTRLRMAFGGAEVLDLSSSGACIRTKKPFVPGTVLNFDLHLFDAGEEVSMLALVKWAREDGGSYLVGLEFVKDHHQEKEKITTIR